jgi:hypothetical protein
MTTFQKLASSSVAAVRQALAKRLRLIETGAIQPQQPPPQPDARFAGEAEEANAEEVQAAQLREAFIRAELNMLRELVNFNVPREAKWLELTKLIQQVSATDPAEKFLIFTEYRGTVAFLKQGLERLEAPGSVAVIMGGMTADARTETIRRFGEERTCRFLISTEAGGEGINLQFCNIVVNYDSPWNPFRVVQRIGRVHRIGQDRNMQVFTFRLRNGLDQRLTECHESRVDIAVARLMQVTGLDAADIRDQLLGMAAEFIDYEKLYCQALKDSEAKSSEQEITDGINKAEEAFKLAYDTIFKHAVSPFNPDRFKKLIRQNLTLEDLHQWLDGYLKTQGRRLLYREAEDLYEFMLPDSIKHHLPPNQRTVKGTFDRKRAIHDASIPLLAFGHPAIDLLLRAALAPDSDGGAAAAQLPPGQAPLAIATAILRQEEHAGSSAYRLVTVECSPDLACTLSENAWSNALKASTSPPPTVDISAVRDSAADFLTAQLPEIDFLADKLHWLSVCYFQKDEAAGI